MEAGGLGNTLLHANGYQPCGEGQGQLISLGSFHGDDHGFLEASDKIVGNRGHGESLNWLDVSLVIEAALVKNILPHSVSLSKPQEVVPQTGVLGSFQESEPALLGATCNASSSFHQ